VTQKVPDGHSIITNQYLLKSPIPKNPKSVYKIFQIQIQDHGIRSRVMMILRNKIPKVIRGTMLKNNNNN
jgi:hypothetical protein